MARATDMAVAILNWRSIFETEASNYLFESQAMHEQTDKILKQGIMFSGHRFFFIKRGSLTGGVQQILRFLKG